MNQTQSKMAVGHIKLESSENTEEMVKEKLQRVNEPGEVVKCLFDPMTMDDIADNFPENLRNAGHNTNRRFNHNSWHSDKRVS